MTAIDAAAVDAAWVSIETPLHAAELSRFCEDIERLYRINPYLEFRRWRRTGPGRYEASWRNTSNGRDAELTLDIERTGDCGFVVRYDRGIKRSTRFDIEEAPGGSRLAITDDYAGAGDSGPLDTSEVDKSLHAWGVALHAYLRREARWGCSPLWRWYMRRVWIPMKPAARRITYILLVITCAEVALAALVVAIYWAERVR